MIEIVAFVAPIVKEKIEQRLAAIEKDARAMDDFIQEALDACDYGAIKD